MNSTKWSRPAQQSERVLICKQPWGCWGAHTHTFEHACTQTHSLRNANFSLYSILKRKMRVVCVCDVCAGWAKSLKCCTFSRVLGELLDRAPQWTRSSFLFHPSHCHTFNYKHWDKLVCVCAFITYFVGMCVFAITQWEEHQLLSIKTLALKKLLHFKLQT